MNDLLSLILFTAAFPLPGVCLVCLKDNGRLTAGSAVIGAAFGIFVMPVVLFGAAMICGRSFAPPFLALCALCVDFPLLAAALLRRLKKD